MRSFFKSLTQTPAVAADLGGLRIVHFSRCRVLAAEAGDVLAGGLVEHLHEGVGGVGCQQVPGTGKRKILDVLELPFAGSLGPDVHDVIEAHGLRLLRKAIARQRHQQSGAEGNRQCGFCRAVHLW